MYEELTRLDVKYLQGVGPKRAEVLEKELGIKSYYDLLYHFPFRHEDRTAMHLVSELDWRQPNSVPHIQIKGRFLSFKEQGEGVRRRLHAWFVDARGDGLECVWFNRVKAIKESLRLNQEYVIYGRPVYFNRNWSITHPEVTTYKPDQGPQGLVGIYNLTEKMRLKGFSSRLMQKLVSNLLASGVVQRMTDPLPAEMRMKYNLMPLAEALVNVHKPTSLDAAQRALYRLKFEELFFVELHILKNIKGVGKKLAGFVFGKVGDYFNHFYNEHLQFPLTGAQKRVIREMRIDMGGGVQMNRLLQGDVGSGKTIVAFLVSLLALDNGFQACLMAPTEILAAQHFETIGAMAEKIGVKVALLTGSTGAKERRVIHETLQDGTLQILIGTHALLEDVVKFRNLGLAIIDEQHRFGVRQRSRLWQKNLVAPPHVLVMTATPIPRTLAMTVYGDLDVSVIDELPPGRKPVNTYLRHENKRRDVMRFVGDELRKGRQVYIVYPLIEKNEKLDLLALEEGYEMVKETFRDYRVAFVHGRMKPAEKDHQMQIFASGEAQILVATTVIEVGVNVPNASVMIIEDAERFGLSQLHQLRGRVGRGAEQSYCVLMAKQKLSKDTRHRLEVMTATNDGFVVAEEDMKLRGPGDIEGTMQSGVPFNLKVANLVTDGVIIEAARTEAVAMLEADPQLASPQGRVYQQCLQFLHGRTIVWSSIS